MSIVGRRNVNLDFNHLEKREDFNHLEKRGESNHDISRRVVEKQAFRYE